MVVLALETATRQGSVAIWNRGTCRSRTGESQRTHGERLPLELLDWLTAAGLRVSDVDLFAVVTGPGSFTGLRVGIAAIQGMALAARRRVVGVPTLDALAGSVLPHEGPVVACLDGQRGDVFCAAYDPRGGIGIDDRPLLVTPFVATPGEAAVRLAARADLDGALIVGDGAVRYAAIFAAALPAARIVPAPVPLAAAAATLAARRPDRALPPRELRPIYVRRPDAELVRERARPADQASRFDGYEIRQATGTSDLTAVEALQRETFTNAWSAQAIRWEIENTDVARLYLMHAPDGTLVGFCACWIVFDELHLNSLAVAPASRRQGAARHLLRHVFGEASAAGAQSATLEVRRSNVPALRLYEGLGFHVEGVRRDYYQGPREDALILWKRGLADVSLRRHNAGGPRP